MIILLVHWNFIEHNVYICVTDSKLGIPFVLNSPIFKPIATKPRHISQ